MKREIKFRAWSKFTERIIPFNGLCSMDEEYELWNDIFNNKDDNFVLMQFTGLKDKNDKEIYEGDIIKTPHFRDINKITFYLYHKVVFNNEMCAFTVVNKRNQDESLTTNGNTFLYVLVKERMFEVVGNIYENPELILEDNENAQKK